MSVCIATCKKMLPHGEHEWVDPNPMGPLCDHAACTRHAAWGKSACTFHLESERRVATALLDTAFGILWDDDNVNAARRTIEIAQLSEEMFLETMTLLENEIAAWEIRAPKPAIKSELYDFVQDPQNVHTKVVAVQMQAGEDILLNTPIPAGQNTLAEIADQWEEKRDADFSQVMRDIHYWYATPYCREEEDHLYARMLDGLWARIKASPYKAELTERLWDEALDGVEMCCDGHIARLCNVMVGFDDAFKPPVSAGEILQNKMAAIAAKEISLGEKVTEAWPVFEELGVPMNERRAWIDAF